MILHTTCSDVERLQALLAGRLPEDAQTALQAHLDTCVNCQRQLERLAAGGDSWPGLERRLGRQPPRFDSALHRAMAALKGDVNQATTPDEATGEDELTLDFLSPSDDPEHLGRFGPYEIHSVIGRGGMGVVLKAWDPSLNRFVAIKVLAPQLATSAAARRRFAREGRASAAVSHEHVVAIHAVDTANGLPYLVMQYVPGVSLQERLDRDGPLELEEILRIGMQTAAGLAAAHAQGLIHRDIKPANILLENGVERVRITDFGLARAKDDASLTQSGVLAGTPQYMAPEQARGEGLDHRADLFSLGSVLYAMCTGGRPPFRADSTMAVLRRVSEDTPRPIQEINARVPDWLAALIERLHAKDPAGRFQSAAEAAELLSQYLAHVQQPGQVPLPERAMADSHPSNPQSDSRPPRARRGLFWKLAAAVLLLAAGVLTVTELTGTTHAAAWAATVLRIRTAEGTLVVEVSDPEIKVSVDGDEVTINGAGIAEVRVRPGKHQVRATRDGVAVHDELVNITRDGKQVVKVTLERTSSARATLKGHVGQILGLAFSPDGKTLITGGADKSVRVWDAGTGKELTILPLKGITGKVVSVAFFPDGNVLVTMTDAGIVQIWDLKTGKEMAMFKLALATRSGAAAPNGLFLAAGGEDGTLRVWDLIFMKHQVSLETPTAIHAIAFSPDGHAVVANHGEQNVRLWHITTSTAMADFRGHTQVVRAVAFAPDGKVLATGSSDQTVKLWEAAGAKEKRTLTGHTGEVASVAFSPDGRRLASASADKTVKVWDAATGQEIQTLHGHTDKVTRVTFSPDGQRLASASADATVRVWDVASEKAQIEALRRQLDQARYAERVALAQAAAQKVQDEAQLRAAEEETRKQFYLNSLRLAQQAWEANTPAPDSRSEKKDKTFRFEMRDKPWNSVLEWLGEQTGRPVVTDAKPMGTFTFIPPQSKKDYTISEIIDILNEALMSQRFYLTSRGRTFAVIPADQKIDDKLRRFRIEDLEYLGNAEQVSLVLSLKSLAAKDVAPEIKKMVGSQGKVEVLEQTNSLILFDTAGNVKRINKLLQDIEAKLQKKQ